MLTDQHAIDLVRRTNPVPDPERVPAPRLDALALLEVARKERAMKTYTSLDLEPTTEPPPGRRRLRSAAAFAAALILMLGAIGVIAFISGDKTEVADDPVVTTNVADTSVIEPPAAPTTVVTTTPATEPPARSPAEIFADGTWATGPTGFWNRQVEPTSMGLFALGDRGVWRSEDGGISWDRVLETPFVPLDPQPADVEPGVVLGEVESSVRAFIEFDSALYVFGTVATDIHTGQGRIDQFVWRSEDGATWVRILLEDVPADATIEDVVNTGSRLVAYLPYGGGTTMLTTEDGFNWTVIAPENSGLEGVYLHNLIAFNDRLLSVGATYEPVERRTVFTSLTGKVWEAGPGFEYDEYPVHSAVAFDETLYLGGFTFDQASDGDISSAVWRSRDGIDFERAQMPVALMGNRPELVATDYGLLGIVSMGPYASEDPWTLSFMVLDDAGEFTLIDADLPANLAGGISLWHATYYDGKLIIIGERTDEPGMPWSWVWTPSP